MIISKRTQQSNSTIPSILEYMSFIKTFSVWQCYYIFSMAVVVGLLSTSVMADHDRVHENTQHHLLMELTPAMCALYPVRANSAQCLNHYNVTVEGLDLGYRCLSSTTPIISPVQRRVLHQIMPDTVFVNQAWRRYGACSPYSAKNYFRQLNELTNQLNIPSRLKESHSFVISRALFVDDMRRANPTISADSIQLTCQMGNLSQPILTKMKICYGEGGFAKCPQVADNCGDNFVIWGSYK